MKKTKFLISSLVAAGIAPAQGLKASSLTILPSAGGPDPSNDDAFVRKFAQDHRFLLAQHRSHSSHASHGSHRSGASGRSPAPVYTPRPIPKPRTQPAPAPTPSRNDRSNPPSSILPSSPATAPQGLFSNSSPSRSQIEDVVRRVQIGLMAYGYYDGKIDGLVGPNTRAALKRFQTDFKLSVTGTITPGVLDAFKISAQ